MKPDKTNSIHHQDNCLDHIDPVQVIFSLLLALSPAMSAIVTVDLFLLFSFCCIPMECSLLPVLINKSIVKTWQQIKCIFTINHNVNDTDKRHMLYNY